MEKRRIVLLGATGYAGQRVLREGGPAVTFAGYTLPVPAPTVASKPGLEDYFGHKVIIGVRLSDFEDAAYGDASWARLPVTAGVIEGLGTETHVIFGIDAPPVEHHSLAGTAAGAAGDEDETVTALAGGSRCGPPGCRPGLRSVPGSLSSSRWTLAACTSSTPLAASPSAARWPLATWRQPGRRRERLAHRVAAEAR